jgi:hypothetical protein
MNQAIIYPQKNGVIAVIIPSAEFLETNLIEDLAAKEVPAGVVYSIIDIDDIPKDRTFRDAWEYGDSININFSKAQTVTKERLRRERTPLLTALDVEFQRAQETQADTSQIVAEKQRLRDITKMVDKAKTLDDLKAITCK